MNNFEKGTELPKINTSKNKDEGTSEEHNNYNTSTIQMSNTAGHIRNKDENEPHIVKIFRKTNK